MGTMRLSGVENGSDAEKNEEDAAMFKRDGDMSSRVLSRRTGKCCALLHL